MCNCVKARATGAPARPAAPLFGPASGDVPAALVLRRAALKAPLFEYVGATALTVIGPASGRRYRFDRPGVRIAVDPLDGAALDAVPHLRRRGDERRA